MVERGLSHGDENTMQSLMLVVLLHEWVLSDVLSCLDLVFE